jgi:hypothetical protein
LHSGEDMSYRPICDTWILARPKIKFYGAYPSGFLSRARALLGVSLNDEVLHVCAGRVKDYPFAGFGPHDMTLDLDPKTKPDFLMDAREIGLGSTPVPGDPINNFWPAILVDRPYTQEDAQHYAECVRDKLPDPTDLLKRCLSIVMPGGRVGWLDYVVPRPPKKGVEFVACVGVFCGYSNRMRAYSVFEREAAGAAERRKRAREAVTGKRGDEDAERGA